jgi:hypothetical protein
MRSMLAAFLILFPLGSHAATVACDARIQRIVQNLRNEPMTPEQTERARQSLYTAIEKCRPLSSGQAVRSSDAAPPSSDGRRSDTSLDRQSLRSQQNVLTLPEQREGERRLDAIDRKAQTDPRAARDMQRLYQADQSLSTINRPIPGGPVSPSMVGPGDRN